MQVATEILLVIPVFNDSRRLAGFAPQVAKTLLDTIPGLRLCIADDGSTASDLASTRMIVEDMRTHGTVELLEFPHRGKGATVRAAWKHFPSAEWLAFVDADGAVPAADIRKLLESAESSGADCLVGERTGRDGTAVRNGLARALAHTSFAWVARRMLGLGTPDPQCGAKIVRGESFRKIEADLHENGFAFDCELLVALESSGARIVSVPINWSEQSGGSVALARDMFPMLQSLSRIRRRFR